MGARPWAHGGTTDASQRSMATTGNTTIATSSDPVVSEHVITTAERSAIASPIGWSAIFGASAVTVGLWLVLHLLGIGIGLTAIDPADPSSLRGVGIGAGVWSLIAPLIALFVGGLVAGRVAPTINTLNAAIHGTVTWAVAAIVALILLTMTISSMVRGAVSTGQAVGSAATSAVSSAANASDASMLKQLGIDANDMIAPINEELRQQGMPAVKAENVEAAAREIVERSVREGGIDRETAVGIVAKRTALTRPQAERLADQLERQADSAAERGGDVLQQVQRTALDAVETTGKVLLVLSITMLLGLLAAIGGSILSVRRERREHVVLPRAVSRA